MNTTARTLIAFLAIFASSYVTATETHNVDEFEYSGISFGMLPKEAQQAVAEHHSISVDDLPIVPIDVNDYPGLQHIESLPWTVTYKQPELTIEVTFVASLDHEDEGFMITDGIEILYGSVRKRSDLQRLDYENALNEYGPPTYERIKSVGWEYGWCSKKHSEREECDRRDSFLIISSVKTVFRNPKIEMLWFAQAADWPKPE